MKLSPPPDAPALVIWLVDDSPGNHDVARRTVALVPGWTLRSFPCGADAVCAFAELAATPEALPDVVLMDFFLGDSHGDEVCRALRRLEPAGRACTVIGYSSMRPASERIVAAGGDLVLKKHAASTGINPDLLRWLRARGR